MVVVQHAQRVIVIMQPCAAAACVNENCATKYLGGELLVTYKPCVCKESWYGDRCDTIVKLPEKPDAEPVCFDGSYFYINTNIVDACNVSIFSKAYYLKTRTQRIPANGVTSGIKCTIKPYQILSIFWFSNTVVLQVKQ